MVMEDRPRSERRWNGSRGIEMPKDYTILDKNAKRDGMKVV